MSTRLVDVANSALAAINAAVQHDADDFVSGLTRLSNYVNASNIYLPSLYKRLH